VQGDPAVALNGGHESVGYESAIGFWDTKVWFVDLTSIAAQASEFCAGPG